MTHDAPEHDDLDTTGDADPLLSACLDDALGPYLGALSPDEIDDYRRLLTIFVTTHPAAAPLHDRLRARPPLLSDSGVVAREGSDDTAAESAAADDRAADDRAAEPGDGTFGGWR
ncbi:hypothetical protein SOCEGT47_007220 [Sorangium cellulosum]|uniref:Uncharacterized protein n=1 Tax=Sorangium cellulosum TaxID=56 RepID=A0A4P2PV09_SORCE|nr:hypothetical protein [Sorangium cellulosum]AUX20256.1 hypothetical protein SOCEGT47_007220 [Sorangium cellulosum]